jgi:hypothetical protein
MVWYEDWKNGTKFFGEGPAVLKERLWFSFQVLLEFEYSWFDK